MEILYELASQNARNKRIIEELIPVKADSQIRKLYEMLFVQPKLNDQEAMIGIYGRVNLTAFSRLKSRMKDALIKTIIFQNPNQEIIDIRANEAINSYRYTLVTRVLLEKRSNTLAIDLLEKAIIKSMKYHITESVLNQARMLVSYYGSGEFNKYKFSKYQDIQKKYFKIYQWEIIAENYYYDLQRIQLQSLANTTEETKARAAKYVDELQNVNGIESYSFNYNKYRVLAAFYEYNKNYQALLQLCERANTEFMAPSLKTGFAISAIRIRRVWALIQSGRLQECIDIGIKGLEEELSGTNNWYFLAHYTLKALLYSKDYAQGAELITKMINHPRYERLGESFKEIFNTTLGYVHLVLESDLVLGSHEIKSRLPEFKLGKFLNTTPVFSKDKRGINVSILLMHIAFLLQRKDYNAIIDRIDSLNQYAYRYLRKDDSFRSNCMIKMVIQMTRADFNPIRTERYTSELRVDMTRMSLVGSGENIEVEIIPFEILWNIMTKSL